MKFPLSIKRKIVLNRDEFSISSEGYIINHIEDYMEQFGMMKQRRDKNELFYLNGDPFRTLSIKRRRLIRNLLYTVEITETNVIITIETAVILVFVICMMIIVFPFFLLPLSEVIIFPIAGLVLYFIHYFIRLNVLNQFKEEVETMVRKLN